MLKRLFLFLSILFTANTRAQELGDVLRFVPYAATFTMKAAGVEGASSWKRLAVNNAIGIGITCGTTYALKKAIDKERPDHSDFDSFPSGHTSFAFAGAHALHKEYGRLSPWISVGGYAVATATALDRIRRDRHDWIDVTAGAAIGIASTELGYWIGDKLTGEKSRFHISATTSGLACRIEF